MASDEADVAVGLTFSMTGFAALNAREILDFTLPPAMKEILNISHQGSTLGQKKKAVVLKDVEPLVLILHHWQDYDYFADIDSADAPVVCTITCPSGATIAFYGILARYEPQQATLNDKMTAQATIEVSNDTAATPSQTIVVTPAA